MKWPGRVQEILNTFAAMHPTWVADDSGPAPTPRYRLNALFAQQVCFEFGPAYGLKRASAGRPVSSENLARREPDGQLLTWAWENQHNGTVDQFPDGEDITGQVFVAVDPVNWFAGDRPIPPAPDPPPPAPSLPPYPGDRFGTIIGEALFADYALAHRNPNEGMGVWFLRTSYDYLAGMPLRESIAKHQAEWRAALGLEP